MAKTKAAEAPPVKFPNSSEICLHDSDRDAAGQLGIVLGGSVEDRITRAVVSYSMAARLAVEAGYLLLSVKSELQHGEFMARVNEIGIAPQRAGELMRMAKFATTLPDAQRAELISMPKTKVLAIAQADPEVIDVLLEDGDVSNLDDLSVRDLRARIRDLSAQLVDTRTAADKAHAEAKAAKQKLEARAKGERDDSVPVVIADLRAEASALKAKAELAVMSFGPLLAELDQVAKVGHKGGDWINGTAAIVLSGLVALRVQIDDIVSRAAEGYSLTLDGAAPALYGFTDQELAEAARTYERLARVHEYEAALRKYERQNDGRPRTKGRPVAKPEAPADA